MRLTPGRGSGETADDALLLFAGSRSVEEPAMAENHAPRSLFGSWPWPPSPIVEVALGLMTFNDFCSGVKPWPLALAPRGARSAVAGECAITGEQVEAAEGMATGEGAAMREQMSGGPWPQAPSPSGEAGAVNEWPTGAGLGPPALPTSDEGTASDWGWAKAHCPDGANSAGGSVAKSTPLCGANSCGGSRAGGAACETAHKTPLHFLRRRFRGGSFAAICQQLNQHAKTGSGPWPPATDAPRTAVPPGSSSR
mmetsp:Transcript_50569/g.141625  ORF Transcript_50569/g.141625 Transcript_50569/m.141625 type:complete len:253 (-) Transcript_50569:10-768(-)